MNQTEQFKTFARMLLVKKERQSSHFEISKKTTSQHAGYFTIDSIELVSDITEHSAGEYNWYTGI